MLPVIDRYVLRELLAPFGLTLGVFTFFLIIDRIYSLTELVITRGVPFHLVLGLLLFMLPSFLVHTLPMALLVAILLAGGRLSSDVEVVAFEASGVGAPRLLRPVMAAAVIVATATLALTAVLVPWSNAALQAQLFEILQSSAAGALKERIFNTTFGDTVIYVEEISPSQVALRGLLVSDERDPKLTRIVTAREGRILADPQTRRITLRLIDGAINESDLAAGRPGEPAAATAREAGRRASAARYRYTAFGIYDMNLVVESSLKGPLRANKPEKNAFLGGLRAQIQAARAKGAPAVPLEVELNKRLALPFAPIAFALVGFALSVGSPRRGRSLALVASLSILVTYYVVMASLEDFAFSGRVPAWVAIWTPNLAYVLLGAGLLALQLQRGRLPRLLALRRALRRRGPARPRPGPAPRERRSTISRDSTHLIDRYLIRAYVTYFGMALLTAASLFAVFDLLQTLDRYLRVKPPLRYILQHFLYRVPVGLHEGLYVVTLVATIFLVLTLSRYHELTAMKAAGISLYRVSVPIVALALLTSVGAGLFQELLLPTLNERGEELDRVKIRGQPPRHLQVQQRIWFRSTDTRFFRLELLDPVGRDLRGVTVLEVDPDFRLLSRLDAGLAHWTSAGWELSDGALREIGSGGRIQTVPFGMTALEMPETFDDFMAIQKPVDQMSFVELRDYIRRLQESGRQVGRYLVALYAKLSFPLVHVVMALVAIPFAVQSPRGGRLVGIGLAILILAGYVLVDRSALAFARADLLPPLMAAWTANIVFLGIALALLVRART